MSANEPAKDRGEKRGGHKRLDDSFASSVPVDHEKRNDLDLAAVLSDVLSRATGIVDADSGFILVLTTKGSPCLISNILDCPVICQQRV